MLHYSSPHTYAFTHKMKPIPHLHRVPLRVTAIGLLVAAMLFLNTLNGARFASAASVPADNHGSAATHYGQLLLSFITNAGQVDSAVRFQVRGSGGTLSFEATGVTLSLPGVLARHPDEQSNMDMAAQHQATRSIGLQLNFEGANAATEISGVDKLPGVANFMIGNDATQWHTNVSTFAGVVYHDLYPGIDLQYGGHAGLLKGTYAVAAGIDPSVIGWRYAGAQDTALNIDGSLRINAPDGVTLTEQLPVAWQMRDGVQTPVSVGYQIDDAGLIQFATGHYDRNAPLIIDPGLVYSTYLGGIGTDSSNGITIDSNGNAYMVGGTSGSFPVVAPFQSGYGGGGFDDQGFGIAVDSTGNTYVCGFTNSTNYPTVNAYQSTLHRAHTQV